MPLNPTVVVITAFPPGPGVVSQPNLDLSGLVQGQQVADRFGQLEWTHLMSRDECVRIEFVTVGLEVGRVEPVGEEPFLLDAAEPVVFDRVHAYGGRTEDALPVGVGRSRADPSHRPRALPWEPVTGRMGSVYCPHVRHCLRGRLCNMRNKLSDGRIF